MSILVSLSSSICQFVNLSFPGCHCLFFSRLHRERQRETERERERERRAILFKEKETESKDRSVGHRRLLFIFAQLKRWVCTIRPDFVRSRSARLETKQGACDPNDDRSVHNDEPFRPRSRRLKEAGKINKSSLTCYRNDRVIPDCTMTFFFLGLPLLPSAIDVSCNRFHLSSAQPGAKSTAQRS